MNQPLAMLLTGALCLMSEATITRRDAASSTRVPTVLADSATAQEQMRNRIGEFHAMWQRFWRDSERYRKRFNAVRAAEGSRSPFQHCHPDGTSENGNDQRKLASLSPVEVIPSKHGYRAACPSWLLGTGVELANDESDGRDGALIDSLRPLIHDARAQLLAELDSSARVWPGNVWLNGERVRLRIDQQDTVGALVAAQACKGEAWWCSALAGFVQARAGKTALAESTFAVMHSQMPRATACNWDDVTQLLDEKDQGSYSKLTCEQRTAVNTQFWWLADPLLRAPTNERRVVDDARRVEIALHRAAAFDERFAWDDKMGGDALVQMVNRYGWPSYTGNMMDSLRAETGHSGWLMSPGVDVYRTNGPSIYMAAHDSPPAAPYTTFEYAIDRLHVAPSWSMVQAPFQIADTSWTLRGERPDGSPILSYWPVEHFRPERYLIPLSDGQTGLFRRQSHTLVASALDLTDSDLSMSAGASYDVMLMTSTGPRNADTLARVIAAAGSTVRLDGLVSPIPRLLGFELVGVKNSSIDARSRFGVMPPPPLDSMKPGEVAISDPVMLVAGDELVPSDGLLSRMLGTTRLDSATRRINVYWETYGLSSTDTVDVFVRIVGDNELSTARRLALAMRLADNPNNAIMQQWTEPDAQRGTRILDGPVPVQMRTITLNVAQLAPGPYQLEVGVARKGSVIAVGRRSMTVLK